MIKILYHSLTFLIHPFLFFLLKKRIGQGKEDPRLYKEKVGIYSQLRPKGKKRVVIHGASVGELMSAMVLVDYFQKNHSDYDILVTSGTKTSAELMVKKGLQHLYAPLDSPQSVASFFTHIQPDIILIIDTEIWPNYLLRAKSLKIPVFAVNMRLSPKAIQAWQYGGGFFTEILSCYTEFYVQNERTALAIRRHHNTPLFIMPNLKWAMEKQAIIGTETYAKLINNRKIILLLSTHDPEEILLIEALRKEILGEVLFVLMPRHPHRAKDIKKGITGKVLLDSKMSLEEDQPDIVIVDALGKVPFWASLAELVIMGNSFIETGKGHNPIEPALYHTALIVGPHMQGFSEITEEFLEANAMIQVQTPTEAALEAKALLQEAGQYAKNAEDLCRKNQQKALDLFVEMERYL